jgi:hypothetical protein
MFSGGGVKQPPPRGDADDDLHRSPALRADERERRVDAREPHDLGPWSIPTFSWAEFLVKQWDKRRWGWICTGRIVFL